MWGRTWRILGSIALAAGILAVATPADAAAPTYYLALGDSLARGVGAPSGQGYVDDIYAFEQQTQPGLQLVNLACSGETTGTMINGGICSYTSGSQLGDAEAFLAAHPGEVSFVTIDIGGNDLAGCFFSIPIDASCVKSQLPGATARLAAILSGLRTAGGTVPIAGLEYYDPFLSYWLQGGAGQTAAHDSVKQLKIGNSALKKAYKKAKAGVADDMKAFEITKFAQKGTWLGQPVPVNVQQACNLTNMCTVNDFHADAAGHSLTATAFEPVLAKLLKKSG